MSSIATRNEPLPLPINRYIDLSALKPELTVAEASEAIKLGLKHDVYAVCVRPADIPLAHQLCRGTQTAVCTVLSFPHGTGLFESKTDEAARYVDMDVAEIDMVVNYALIRSGEWKRVEQDIRAAARVTRPAKVILKVILETAALNTEQIARATGVAIAAEADFVKTSTGFGFGGATEEAVAAMLRAAASRIGVKASGGIRDRATAEKFIRMGCTRLGIGYGSVEAVCG